MTSERLLVGAAEADLTPDYGTPLLPATESSWQRVMLARSARVSTPGAAVRILGKDRIRA